MDRVKAMLRAYIEFGLHNPNAYQLLFCSSLSSFSAAKLAELKALGGQCYALFLEAVGRMAAAGRLKAADVDAAAQALWTAAHGLVALRITRPDFPWLEKERLVATVIDGLFNGLAKP